LFFLRMEVFLFIYILYCAESVGKGERIRSLRVLLETMPQIWTIPLR
jgi:hypothetical protein